jgi:hypothetical protein
MKKALTITLLTVVFVLGIVYNISAQVYMVVDSVNTVQFEWEYPNPPSDLQEFRVYQSSQSGVYTYGEGKYIVRSDKTDFNAMIENVPEGKLFFVVTAVDIFGHESLPSNEIILMADYTAPDAPTKFKCLNLNIHIKIN